MEYLIYLDAYRADVVVARYEEIEWCEMRLPWGEARPESMRRREPGRLQLE